MSNFNSKETISIEKFRKLHTRVEALSEAKASGKKKFMVQDLLGDFALTRETHSKQCENLKVGDIVFFLRGLPPASFEQNPSVEIHAKIVMARVVEEKTEVVELK